MILGGGLPFPPSLGGGLTPAQVAADAFTLDALAGIYNPRGLLAWHQKLRAPGRKHLAVLGDSIDEGANATDYLRGRMSHLLAQRLGARFGGDPETGILPPIRGAVAAQGWAGAGDGLNVVASGTVDPQRDVEGVAQRRLVVGQGGWAEYAFDGTAPGRGIDGFDLCVARGSITGVVSWEAYYDVGGVYANREVAASGSFDSNLGGNPEFGSWFACVAGGLDPTRLLKVRIAATTNQLFLEAIHAFRGDRTNGVQVSNLAQYGAKTVGRSNALNLGALQRLAPRIDLLVENYGTNDASQGTSLTEYETNLRNVYAPVVNAGGSVVGIVEPFSGNTSATMDTWRAFRDVKRKIADDYPEQIAVLDWWRVCGNTAYNSGDPRSVTSRVWQQADSVHYSDKAQTDRAEILDRVLSGSAFGF